jgi:O-antigen ligase
MWATLSLLWSAAPAVSLGKLRTDLWLPLLAAVAAFYFVREAEGLRHVVRGLAVGLVLLTCISIFAYLPVAWAPSWIPFEQAGGIVHPLPHWYPGPGDASMFTILSIAPLMLAWHVWPKSRRFVVMSALLLAFVLVTTNNRNAVLVAPVVVIFQWLLDRRAGRVAIDASSRDGAKRRFRSIALSIALVAIVLVALLALLEFGARERLAYLHKPLDGDSAAVELVENDTRPVIWRYYFTRGLEHPWIGVGFGRTVPGIGWQTESDRALAAIEPNAYIHAHNVLLNWWLQLGAVGLAMLATVLTRIAWSARRSVRDRGDARWVYHALLTTLLATLARNLTDDFLVYGMATVFCIIVAALLGELSRRDAASIEPADPSTSRRIPSAPS